MSNSQSKFPASKDDILALLRSRELTTSDTAVLTPCSREQYKNKKIKKYNNISRNQCEDVVGSKVSDETCLLASTSSTPQALVAQEISLESETSSPRSQGQEEGNVISPRELTSRWSGISVHHVRSKKGVKLGITLQKPDWVDQGRTLQITAELKRYDRLREVKADEDDTEFFVEYLRGVKELLKDEKDKTACLGRAHQRGARKAWIQDTLVLANIVHDRIERIVLYVEGDQFEIAMDHAMSERQTQVYHSTGYHGRIVLSKRKPRIDELPTTQYI